MCVCVCVLYLPESDAKSIPDSRGGGEGMRCTVEWGDIKKEKYT